MLLCQALYKHFIFSFLLQHHVASIIKFTFLITKLSIREVMKHIQDHIQLVNSRAGILDLFLFNSNAHALKPTSNVNFL